MHKFPFWSTAAWLVIFRIVVSFLMVAHGAIRVYADTVENFGDFLDDNGFPGGTLIAWAITLFEIAGGLMLASGLFIRLICVLFITELSFGILLVHLQNGWFVVGYSSGGIEYSVLLILCFFVIASTGKNK